jgi:GTPase involved in cell partitioning and DNA repair
MKKIVFIIALFLVQTLSAQTDAYKSMSSMTDSLKSYISVIENKNQEIVSIQLDNTEKNQDRESYRNLNKNWTYKVFIFGDWRIKSIAIEVYKILNDGTSLYVTGEVNEHSYASAVFKPSENGYYRFIVTAVKFHSDYTIGHYGFILFHE